MSNPNVLYRFRPGALDHIMRTRNLSTDEQLAAVIRVHKDDIPKLRAGSKVSAVLALHVATVQGDQDFLGGYFDTVFDNTAPAIPA